MLVPNLEGISINLKKDNLFSLFGLEYKINFKSFSVYCQELAQLLTVIKKEEYNTNNAWGFGGVRGYWLDYGDFKILAVKQCFRHAKDSPYYIKDVVFYD